MSIFMDFEENQTQHLKTHGANEEGYPTDVNGVYADDQAQHGCDSFPIFDVDRETFAAAGSTRKRIRAPYDSKLQEYMSHSIYNRPFYLRHIDENGNESLKLIK